MRVALVAYYRIWAGRLENTVLAIADYFYRGLSAPASRKRSCARCPGETPSPRVSSSPGDSWPAHLILHLAGIAAHGSHLTGIRLKVRAVSHGRVVFDTHNEVRFAVARCLVSFWILYTRKVEKVSGCRSRLIEVCALKVKPVSEAISPVASSTNGYGLRSRERPKQFRKVLSFGSMNLREAHVPGLGRLGPDRAYELRGSFSYRTAGGRMPDHHSPTPVAQQVLCRLLRHSFASQGESKYLGPRCDRPLLIPVTTETHSQ